MCPGKGPNGRSLDKQRDLPGHMAFSTWQRQVKEIELKDKAISVEDVEK